MTHVSGCDTRTHTRAHLVRVQSRLCYQYGENKNALLLYERAKKVTKAKLGCLKLLRVFLAHPLG